MLIKDSISIEEFDSKNYKVRLVEPIVEAKAILTHYLHNIHNGVSKYYKEDALKVLKNYTDYKREDEASILAEEIQQYLLFEVENVPFPTPQKYTFKFISVR